MRVILYGPDFNRRHEVGWVTTLAFSEGLTSLGIEHDVRETRYWERDGSEIADVCIVNGWWKKFIESRGNRTNRNTVIRAQQAAGKDPWCIERGFLLDREEWSGVSIGGFCSNGGDFRAEGMPPDRWDAMGIELQPWRERGEYILLCAQVPWDTQVQDGNHLHWLRDAVAEIRAHTDRPIRFRGHPKAWRQRNPYAEIAGKSFAGVEVPELRRPPETTFEEDLAGAHAVVCYNSNVATLATVAGVPVFTGGQCLADPIANRDWSKLENPDMPDRRRWAWDLAYKQWHIEDFRKGLPWVHLTR